ETYDLSKLKSAKLCGKAPALLNFPMEATVLTFEDGSTKTIFDDFYKDIWKLKSVVDHKINHQEAQALNLVDNGDSANNAEFKSIVWYKGNPLLSGRGIMIWTFLLYIVYSALTDNRPGYLVELFA